MEHVKACIVGCVVIGGTVGLFWLLGAALNSTVLRNEYLQTKLPNTVTGLIWAAHVAFVGALAYIIGVCVLGACTP